MKRDNVDKETIEEATYQDFYKMSVPSLKHFILARNKDIPKSRLPKRGKPADAILGEKNLVRLAHDFKFKPNLLSKELE